MSNLQNLKLLFASPALPNLITLALAVLCLIYLWRSISYYCKIRSFPLVNGGGFLGLSSFKARNEFITNCKALIRDGFTKNRDALRIQTDFAEVILLSPDFAEEIRNEERLSAGKYTETELMGFIPGLEPFAFAGTHRKLMYDVITSRLNRALPTMCDSVSIEVANSLENNWTDEAEEVEWHQVSPYQTALMMVAQATVSVFLGKELSRNKRWIEINTQFTVVALGAVNSLRKWPRFLLPLIHHFHQAVKTSRALLDEARAILSPIYERSSREVASGKAGTDSLAWFEELSKGQEYDPTVAQLTFAVAAIHSTTDLLCQILFDLANNPEIVQALREELIDVLTKNGWQQSSFNQLKLMDSVMKESQRIKPISRVFNKRVAMQDIKLSRGVELPKNSYVAVSAHRMMDPCVYPDPEKWDAYRFVKRAQDPQHARFSNFSTVSPEHTGFGFGKHACPGRIYVTQELKILLAHILLKYDWKLPDGYKLNLLNHGFDTMTDVMASLLISRRKEEIRMPA